MHGFQSTSVHRGLAALAFAATLAIVGCGGGNPAPSGSSKAEDRADRGASESRRAGREPAPRTETRPSDESAQANSLVRTDADGRKWIEDIPLDVWYDDPLGTYQSNAHVAVANGGAIPVRPRPRSETPLSSDAGSSSSDTAGETAPAGTGAATDWNALISAAVLDAETKSLRNQLTSAMQTVATYNSNFQAIQWDGATLCALAGIAAEHADPVSWKDRAPHVRDLAQRIEEAAQERGRTAFEATQLPYEQLISVLSGNEPAGLEPAEPRVPFAQSASRGGIMRRMQESFDWLSKNVNTADRLESEQAQAIHEASVLAALTRVISHEGYDAADEPDYAQEARGLIEDAQGARAASEAGSFDAFREAVDRMGTRCGNCHGKYRFSE